MARYAYYPGCTLKSSASEYEASVKAVFNKLGHELEEIDSWICCGASPAHQSDAGLSSDLAAYNILAAADSGLDILAPCAACFNRLKAGAHKLKNDDVFRKRAETEFNHVAADVEILSPVGVLNSPDNLDAIKAMVADHHSELKLVAYYGCLLVRPPKIMQFDDPEDPVLIDKILGAAGFTLLPWEYKTECCGGSLAISNRESALRLTAKVLNAARKAGAEAIVVACPLCHQNLDARQSQVNAAFNEKFAIPIYYFTELLAFAMGFEPTAVGIDKHVVESVKVLRRGA